MIQITIRYGTDSVTKSYEEGTSIGSIIGSPSVKAALGYGDNVRALINGVEQNSVTIVDSLSTIVVETKCNSKAV